MLALFWARKVAITIFSARGACVGQTQGRCGVQDYLPSAETAAVGNGGAAKPPGSTQDFAAASAGTMTLPVVFIVARYSMIALWRRQSRESMRSEQGCGEKRHANRVHGGVS
ncbi:hypothetical protein [Variovorax sp. RA8]|uniref:hypothetical protein n=1 Tax=Variovorax sp. (strain JCM 16519 / RA8) TaxID=662548 RepID=UPI0013A549E0|nr:hypothetical protein [Variovorax sp. RA8]